MKIESITDYSQAIRRCLEATDVTYNGHTVSFKDGSVIGGVLANNTDELVDMINKCLNRGDFHTPQCIKNSL